MSRELRVPAGQVDDNIICPDGFYNVFLEQLPVLLEEVVRHGQEEVLVAQGLIVEIGDAIDGCHVLLEGRMVLPASLVCQLHKVSVHHVHPLDVQPSSLTVAICAKFGVVAKEPFDCPLFATD